MIAKMKKVSLVGTRDELKNIIEAVKETGEFQITFYKNAGTDLTEADIDARTKMNTQLTTIKNMLAFINADGNTIAMTYKDLKKAAKKETAVLAVTGALEKMQIGLNELKNTQSRNKDMITALTPYTALPIPASYIKNTKHAFVLAGIMPERELTRYKNDIDTENFIIETYDAKHGKIITVISGDIDELPIADAIYNYGFTAFPPNYNFEKTPAEQIAYLTEENAILTDRIAEAVAQAKIPPEDVNLLKIYYDYLLNELDTFEILTATMQTKECFVVNGWIPAKIEKRFTETVLAAGKVVVKTVDATETDNPPVLTKNTAVVAPYSSVTAMHGMPGRTDIDPTPFVAFFYFLFFGVMFGDLGYGLLLFAATAGILIFKKPKGGMKQMMGLFLMGGISAVLWGAVFNSFFGTGILVAKAVIDPMADATLFLAMSLYLGIVQLAVGTLLNFYNILRQGRIADAFMGALPHFVLMAGFTMAFPSLIGGLLGIQNVVVDWFQPLGTPGVWTALAGVAGIILFNGRNSEKTAGKRIAKYFMGAASGAYGLINYFSDILSYARLFGVGLAGSVIGYVGNYICGMFMSAGILGAPFGIIVAVVFHAINIGLGLLSAYVHNSRLQFVEFFGKFYSGEGKAFAPLGSKLRYIRIK